MAPPKTSTVGVQSTLSFRSTKSTANVSAKAKVGLEKTKPVVIPAPKPVVKKEPEPEPIIVESSGESDDSDEETLRSPISARESPDGLNITPSKSYGSGKPLKEIAQSPQFKRELKVIREKAKGDPVESTKNEHPALTILRVFDTTYDFGPSVGIDRLERWERAEKLGLEPPPLVRDIIVSLQDKEDIGKVDLRNSVFHGQV